MKLEDFHKLDNRIMASNVLYNDIDVSYILRNHVIDTIRIKKNEGYEAVLINKKLIYRFVKSSFKTIHSFFKMKKIWVFSSAESRKMIDGVFYDRVASIVGDSIDNVVYIETPVVVNHRSPTNDIILSESIFYLGSFIFGYLFFSKKKLHVEKELLDCLSSFNINLKFENKVKRFIGQYEFMKFFIKYFYKPQLVFSVCPSSYYGYNYAFKQFKIPIVELQHGVIYTLHPSYNSTLKDKDKMFKPDYIFTYGTRDKKTIEELFYVPEENCFVVGSFGLWKTKQAMIHVNSYLRGKINNYSKTLVVAATTDDVLELYDFCIDLEKLDSNLRILLLPRREVTILKDTENVKVLNVEKTNIFETYRVADFVLSKVSTAALESLFMDIPTFILENESNSFFKKNYSFIKSFNYIKSAKDLDFRISHLYFKTPLKNDVEQLFALDVLENFNMSVNRILNLLNIQL